LLPSSFVDFSKSILYSLGFSSNFYFHYSGQQYGAESGLLKPFLHTWSLSVEEQFYILFPIVLLIIFKYFRKYLIHILILGFVISLSLADWGSKNHPSFNFYALPTRVWELLAGSILAYFEITGGGGRVRFKYKIFNLILPSIGLFLIGHSILFFNDKMFHPSFYTLSPIMGICLIIWYSNKDELITKILSTKLFVGIGLISYSLYLWHYPIFAFTINTFFLDGTISKKLIVAVTTIILSIFSYYFIEKPYRCKSYQFKKIFILIITLFFILLSFNLYVINDDGIKTRLPKIFQKELRAININFYQKDNTQKVVLIGDSHAGALGFNLNEEIKKKDLSLIRFVTPMYLTDFNYAERKTKKIDKNFIESNIKIDNFLKENSNLIVVFHQRWTLRLLEMYFDNEEGYKEAGDLEHVIYLEPINVKTASSEERIQYIKKALHSQINNIVNQGHKLILVYPVPEVGVSPYVYLFRNYIFNKNLFNNILPVFSVSNDVYKKRNKLIFQIFDSIKNENIYRVYPHSYFCNKQIKDRCVTNDENDIFYYDGDHLSIQGSKFVVDGIMKEIEKIELKSY
jgi:peptidoglycan/LPS O-acetylase OafA/YrhL